MYSKLSKLGWDEIGLFANFNLDIGALASFEVENRISQFFSIFIHCHFKNCIFKDLQKAPFNTKIVPLCNYIYIRRFLSRHNILGYRYCNCCFDLFLWSPKLAKNQKLNIGKYGT